MKRGHWGWKSVTCRKSGGRTVREAVGASQRWVWWAVERALDLETRCIRTFLGGCRLRSNLSNVLNP